MPQDMTMKRLFAIVALVALAIGTGAQEYYPAGGGSGSSGGGYSDVINVLEHGVTGDARQVTDAVTTDTSTTVTSATANFDSARDVGKVVWGSKLIGGGDGNPISLPVGTIVSVTNATTIVVSNAAVLSNTGVYLTWGTDDTDALQAAFALAFNGGDVNDMRNIYLPAGGYIIDELIADWRTATWNSPTITGAGSKHTNIILKADYDFGTIVAGHGAIVATGTTAPAWWEGFAINGASFAFGNGLDWTIAVRSAGSSIRDVEVHHVQSNANANAGFIMNTCGSFEISTRCIFEDVSLYAVSGQAVFANSSIGIWRNVLIYEMEGATIDNGSHVVVEGGNYADHFVSDNICLVVSGGATAVFFGGSRFRHELSVTGNNTQAIINAALVDDPIRIGAGATVRISNSKFSGVTDGTWFINAGTAYDLGGNSYLNAGASPVQTKAPYGFLVPTAFTLVPTCNAANEGQRNMITDSDTTTWADAIAGGGADKVLGYCNGTDWTVAAR